MKTIYLMFILLAAIFVSCDQKDDEPASTKGDIYVTVKSSSGYPSTLIKGAGVFTVPATKQGVTDEFGTVLLKDVEAGTYEVYANLEGFGSGKSVLKVKADSLSKITIQIVGGVKTGFTPEISLSLPGQPALFSMNEPIVFSADVKDLDSGPQDITVVISSSLDGKLFEGHPDGTNVVRFETSSLSAGVHQITITATDKDKYSSVYVFDVSTLAPSGIFMDQVSAQDGQVTVSWKKYTSSDFLRYEVYRSTSKEMEGSLVTSFGSADSVQFIDKTPPFVSELYYYVRIVNKSNYWRTSSYLRIAYPAGKFYYYSATDAVIHPTESVVYIIDRSSNQIRSINYATGEEKNSPVLKGEPGKMDIGENGFGLELYVPSSDGNIYVYNAESLSLKATIVTGLPTRCVTTNGHGYLVASLTPNPWWEMPVRTYSRSTGLNVSGNSGIGTVFEASMLRFIPGTDNLISISTSVSPTDMDYFELDQSGNVVSQKDDSYHGDYDLDPLIFRISTNGQFLVTGQTGAVYSASSTMIYKGLIQRGALLFSDFAFSDDGNTIYAATSNRNSIQIVKYPELTRTDEYLLKGYPKFIFKRNDELISISRIDNNSTNFAIERVKIN